MTNETTSDDPLGFWSRQFTKDAAGRLAVELRGFFLSTRLRDGMTDVAKELECLANE